MYEMLVGLPPFFSQKHEEVFERIKFAAVRYPKHLSPAARDLLDGLLQKDPDRRLGGGPADFEEINAHPWFAGVDYEAFLAKKVQAPFIPTIASDLDISNFDPVSINFDSQ